MWQALHDLAPESFKKISPYVRQFLDRILNRTSYSPESYQYFSWVENPNVIWVDLSRLDFTEGRPIHKLNPRITALSGDVSQSFEPL